MGIAKQACTCFLKYVIVKCGSNQTQPTLINSPGGWPLWLTALPLVWNLICITQALHLFTDHALRLKNSSLKNIYLKDSRKTCSLQQAKRVLPELVCKDAMESRQLRISLENLSTQTMCLNLTIKIIFNINNEQCVAQRTIFDSQLLKTFSDLFQIFLHDTFLGLVAGACNVCY